jgi:glutamyl-tRNA reductase
MSCSEPFKERGEEEKEEEEEEGRGRQLKQQASAEVVITNTCQRTRLCCCVPLVAKERTQSTPDVMQCLVSWNITQK